MALTTSLVSYWKLDEASGDALDAVGSNTLTDNNTVTSVAGKINTARQFTAANNEFFNKADNASLSTGNIDWTISLWCQFDSLGAVSGLVQKSTGFTTDTEHSVYKDTDDKIKFLVSPGAFVFVATVATVTTGTWYNVVFWHDSVNDVIGLAVNNGTPVTTAFSSGTPDTTADFIIGQGGNNTVANGRIDEVGFWKRVLTAQERTDLYNNGSGFAYPFTPAATTSRIGRVPRSMASPVGRVQRRMGTPIGRAR